MMHLSRPSSRRSIRATAALCVAAFVAPALVAPALAGSAPLDATFVSGGAGAVGLAEFRPVDPTPDDPDDELPPPDRDSAAAFFPLAAGSRSYTASGGTSTGPIRGTLRTNMTIAPLAAAVTRGGPAQQLRLDVEGEANFAYDGPFAGGGGGSIDLGTSTGINSQAAPIAFRITGDGPIAYAINDASTPFYAPSIRDAATGTSLAASGTLLPGLYEIDFIITASASYDDATGTLQPGARSGVTDWQLLLSVPEPTTLSLAAAAAALVAGRRRGARRSEG